MKNFIRSTVSIAVLLAAISSNSQAITTSVQGATSTAVAIRAKMSKPACGGMTNPCYSEGWNSQMDPNQGNLIGTMIALQIPFDCTDDVAVENSVAAAAVRASYIVANAFASCATLAGCTNLASNYGINGTMAIYPTPITQPYTYDQVKTQLELGIQALHDKLWSYAHPTSGLVDPTCGYDGSSTGLYPSWAPLWVSAP